MKLRRQNRFHGIRQGVSKKPDKQSWTPFDKRCLEHQKIRQTWNKYNLWNMVRAQIKIDPGSDTLFQQKWKAKAMTRAYHGEHVSERRWERAFSRRLLSVVSMDPTYMARDDGSSQVSGRGSGLQMKTAEQLGAERRRQLMAGEDMLTGSGVTTRPYTPYMNMTFSPLERRLDTAIFRAMFASSARQARNFVVHGHVKVNGIKVCPP